MDRSPFGLDAPAPATAPNASTTPRVSDLNAFGDSLVTLPDPAAPGEYIAVATTPDLACPQGPSAAYSVGVGTPSGLQTQAAWNSSPDQPVACQAAVALTGGGSSDATIGMLDAEGPAGNVNVYYRSFDPTNDMFGSPTLVSAETQFAPVTGGEDMFPAASRDTSGAVYATWVDDRGTVFTYSPDGGTHWLAPIPLSTLLGSNNVGAQSGGVLAGEGDGDATLAYWDIIDGDEYLLQLSYQELRKLAIRFQGPTPRHERDFGRMRDRVSPAIG
jgi:hypothetical protein